MIFNTILIAFGVPIVLLLAEIAGNLRKLRQLSMESYNLMIIKELHRRKYETLAKPAKATWAADNTSCYDAYFQHRPVVVKRTNAAHTS